MSVEFLKVIRETERKCEQKIKKAETAKQDAIMEAEKQAVLKVRDVENQAKEEANTILSSVKNRVDKEYVKMLNQFEEEQNNLKDRAKKVNKDAINLIFAKIL